MPSWRYSCPGGGGVYLAEHAVAGQSLCELTSCPGLSCQSEDGERSLVLPAGAAAMLVWPSWRWTLMARLRRLSRRAGREEAVTANSHRTMGGGSDADRRPALSVPP
jgi:hypothetical protein